MKYPLEEYIYAISDNGSECDGVAVTYTASRNQFTFSWHGHTWGHEKTLLDREMPPKEFARLFLQQHREARNEFKQMKTHPR